MAAIILLHGAIGAADQLQPLAAQLQGHGHEVYSFSFSGHGRIPFRHEGFGIELFADELRHFITAQQLTQPHVFGYSMGGYVALYAASRYQDLLGHIATLGTKFHWTPEVAQKESRMLDAGVIISKVPAFAKTLEARHGDDWKILLEKTVDMMGRLGQTPLLGADQLPVLNHKIMLGLADADHTVTIDETHTVYRQLKQGSMYMLPNGRHPIETVHVTLLGQLLQAFFS